MAKHLDAVDFNLFHRNACFMPRRYFIETTTNLQSEWQSNIRYIDRIVCNNETKFLMELCMNLFVREHFRDLPGIQAEQPCVGFVSKWPPKVHCSLLARLYFINCICCERAINNSFKILMGTFCVDTYAMPYYKSL
jgi:hypothetical protein